MAAQTILSHQVLLFASAADALGCASLPVPLADGATAGDLLAVVSAAAERASGRPLPNAARVAVNQTFAAPELVLRAGDEVAVIPPVAGG